MNKVFECLILGDSIAVGVSNVRQECVSYSKVGWNTWQWNRDYLKNDLTANTVIISLGSNDHKHINTRKELEKMRDKVKGSRVFWILPNGNLKASEVPIEHIQDIVRDIANKNGDTVLPITRVQSDNIHPSWVGYKDLAMKTK